MNSPQPIDVLLVDDDEGDVLLIKKSLVSNRLSKTISTARDGVEALDFLRRRGRFAQSPRPDLILLDLNMPRKDGRETLAEIKADAELRSIPVVVLTTSDAESDISRSYDLQASSFVTKPMDLRQFNDAMSAISDFWLGVAKYTNS